MIGLRRRLIQIVLLSGILIAGTVVCAAAVYYVAQKKWNFNQTTDFLENKVGNQVRDLAASFLIPEQSAGRSLLLEKYIADEKLQTAIILEPNDPLPDGFKKCEKAIHPVRCENDRGDAYALLTPIAESGVIFGYLFKAKFNDGETTAWVFRYAGVAFLVLILVIGTIILMISKIYGQVVSSLKSLELWTEKVVLGKDENVPPKVSFSEFKFLGQNIKKLIDDGNRLKNQAVASEVARQVAHDIRSPVSALSVLVDCTEGKDFSADDRRIISNSTQRIREITDSFTHRDWTFNSGPVSKQLELTRLSEVVEIIVSEKRAQYKNNSQIEITFQPDAQSRDHVFVDAPELKRVLSNLINNAVESLPSKGKVSVLLDVGELSITLKIVDTGSGISDEILSQLGKREFSSKATIGSGIGVFHAFKVIHSFGGEIWYQSKEQYGTTVSIKLPKAITSLVEPIPVKPCSQIIIVEDDRLVHEAWKMLLPTLLKENSDTDVLHFYSYREFKSWFALCNPDKPKLFFVDYDLPPEKNNGLDLIDELDISESSILVSGRCNEPEIQERARQMGVRICSKERMNEIQLVVTTDLEDKYGSSSETA